MLVIFIALAVVMLLPLAAQANLLTNGDFEIINPFIPAPLSAADSATQNHWRAGASWVYASEGGNYFAQYDAGGEQWLLQGVPFAPPSCINSSWKIRVSFSYQLPDLPEPVTGQVKVAGLKAAGVWDPATGLLGPSANDFEDLLTDSALSDSGAWETYQNSINYNSTAFNGVTVLGIGFNLAAGTGVSMKMDNVVMDLVAPVSLKITPNTLNLKSQGNWVTAFISKPPSCYSLADIDQTTIKLSLAGTDTFIMPVSFNRNGRKFMMKFDRSQLINLINGATGAVTLTISGAFNDEVLFEGSTSLRVINPGKGPKKPKI